MHADGVEYSPRLHLYPASRLTHRDEKAARLTLPSAAPATSPRRARSARTRTKAHGGTKDKARACRRGWGERAASDGSPARRQRSRGPASAAISGTPRHRIRILRGSSMPRSHLMRHLGRSLSRFCTETHTFRCALRPRPPACPECMCSSGLMQVRAAVGLLATHACPGTGVLLPLTGRFLVDLPLFWGYELEGASVAR